MPAPTISSISISNIGRTSAVASISGDAKSLTPTYYWKIGSSSYSSSGASYTFTGLTPNTGYSYSGYFSTAAGTTTTKSGSFTTAGNAPTINSVSPAPSRTTCSLANNSISYDTNASFKSVSVRYGTSTSYGSTASSTSLSGLQPNTTYYYSMTVTDN